MVSRLLRRSGWWWRKVTRSNPTTTRVALGRTEHGTVPPGVRNLSCPHFGDGLKEEDTFCCEKNNSSITVTLTLLSFSPDDLIGLNYRDVISGLEHGLKIIIIHFKFI